MRLDENVVSAIAAYFKYGLYPGSFVTELLDDSADLQMLVNLAHPHIRNLVDDHRWFVQNCVPLCCRNEYFNTWEGYAVEVRKDPSLKLAMSLSIAPTSVTAQWIKDVEIQNSAREMVKEFVKQDRGK